MKILTKEQLNALPIDELIERVNEWNPHRVALVCDADLNPNKSFIIETILSRQQAFGECDRVWVEDVKVGDVIMLHYIAVTPKAEFFCENLVPSVADILEATYERYVFCEIKSAKKIPTRKETIDSLKDIPFLDEGEEWDIPEFEVEFVGLSVFEVLDDPLRLVSNKGYLINEIKASNETVLKKM